jgi:aminoglycoside phosphotransferase
VIAHRPTGPKKTPAAVNRLIDGGCAEVVWENELGGLTFEVKKGIERLFIKWAPHQSGLDHAAEAARLEWAGAFARVPQVLGRGCDDEGSWMMTAPVPGRSAVSERWRRDPGMAVKAIGEGLRALHETLPVDSCPFSWSAPSRVDDARRRAGLRALDPGVWHRDHSHLSVEQALQLVADPPPIDRLVVCHGDACAPNTLIDDEGRWSGHVDLGALGVADRWADLAIATWSTEWNFGPGWEDPLLDAYGADPDRERTHYYRLLWDLGP